jgi:hypothetical protein
MDSQSLATKKRREKKGAFCTSFPTFFFFLKYCCRNIFLDIKEGNVIVAGICVLVKKCGFTGWDN